jgi:hypothetical protein
MGGWLASLVTWCRLPVRDGIAELDIQIDKLRLLRDSYQAPGQGQPRDHTTEVKKGGEQLCIP